MNAKGTKPTRFKPARPYKDFPLFAHSNGQWAKKIRGKHVYFGPWEDWGAANSLYQSQKDDLYKGNPVVRITDEPTVADVCNVFLTAKTHLRDAGEIAPRTFDRLHATCAFLCANFPKTKLAKDLGATDFTALRAVMARRWGPVALGNEIQAIRGIFKFAYESEQLESQVRFGPSFKRPSAKTLRLATAARGSRLMSPAEIKAALKHATPNAKAMILLGINGALGNTDLALLPTLSIDFKNGWLNYARTKTGVPRRIPLWPETITAMRSAFKQRGEPRDKAEDSLFFIGRRGQSYVGGHKGYRVHQELSRVFAGAGLEGRTPYDLRHTFSTVAEGTRDLPAVQAIMGHAASGSDMAARYRQGVDDMRLRAVANYVRGWLWPQKKARKAK